MKTLIRFIPRFFIITFLPLAIFAESKSFYKNEVNCNDDEKILKIINKTKNENRIMCLKSNHSLHEYIKKNKGNEIMLHSVKENKNK